MKVDFSGEELKVYDFNDLEAYKIARKLESDAIYYYSRVKDEVLKPEIREVIETLMAEERQHLEHFEEKISELSEKYDEPDDDESLAEIVDSKVSDVLKDSGQVANILCNPQEALRLGVSVERRAIAFYNEILQNTEDESGKAALRELISEEEEHFNKLEAMIRK